MVDLILREGSLAPKERPYALQLRDHGPVETDYTTLCYVDLSTAKEIIEAGTAYWLFGPPDKPKPPYMRSKKRSAIHLSVAEVLQQALDKLELLEVPDDGVISNIKEIISQIEEKNKVKEERKKSATHKPKCVKRRPK